LDLSIEASAKLEALRWPAAWHRFTLACRVAPLYAGLPRGTALRGLSRGEALRGFRLGQIVQDSQKQ
jgi:hypothetical protein